MSIPERMPDEEHIEEIVDAAREVIAAEFRERCAPLEPHEETALHFVLSATLDKFLGAISRNRKFRS